MCSMYTNPQQNTQKECKNISLLLEHPAAWSCVCASVSDRAPAAMPPALKIDSHGVFCREINDRARACLHVSHSCTLIKVSSFFGRRFWPGAIYWSCVCRRSCMCVENIKVVGSSRSSHVWTTYIDAVPTLKGHQQKPTYVEHDSRLLSCIYFSSSPCHKFKLVEISSDWFDCILFLLMSVQSTSCRINDNIWYTMRSYFKLVYCKIRDWFYWRAQSCCCITARLLKNCVGTFEKHLSK